MVLTEGCKPPPTTPKPSKPHEGGIHPSVRTTPRQLGLFLVFIYYLFFIKSKQRKGAKINLKSKSFVLKVVVGDGKFEKLVEVAVNTVAETQDRLSVPLVHFRHQTDAYVSFFNGGT